MQIQFEDRAEAGRFLASKLKHYANQPDVLVLALPRGGVPVAYAVAKSLQAPLDMFVVRKLGVPGYEEMAMGAIASGGIRVINPALVQQLALSEEVIEQVVAEEYRELQRRESAYRNYRPSPQIEGKTVILVDDGLATGASMWAAVIALRQLQPAHIVVAVPTASQATCAAFAHEVDEVICGITPKPFYAVGLSYKDFSQTSDDEVRDLLERAAMEQPVSGTTS
jgi:putative phosphoribosyl transferase